MKNLIKSVILLTFIGTLFVGCEKEDSLNEDINIETTLKNKTTNDKSNEITYISETNFESEFEIFAQAYFNKHPTGLIGIEFNPSTLMYALTTDNDGEVDPATGAKIVCRGSNVTSCVNNYNNALGTACNAIAAKQYYGDGSGRFVWVGVTLC